MKTLHWVGWSLFACGLGLETLADHQKTVFRREPVNHGRYIHTGVWAYSRHPNYLGEIMLWTGLAIAATPSLTTWLQLAVTVSSPLFVAFLLVRVGIFVSRLFHRDVARP